MNTARIVVIGLVALALGILVGVGFQGSISQVLNLDAAAPTTTSLVDIWNQRGTDYVSDPRLEASHLATLKDGLLHSTKLRLRGHTSGNTDTAADGYMWIYDPTLVEGLAGGPYSGYKWGANVFTGCFNSGEEDRIKAIMQSTGKGRNRAIIDLMVELAQQNKDDRLIKLTIGPACLLDTGLNR